MHNAAKAGDPFLIDYFTAGLVYCASGWCHS
jgi:hypothetical protein